MIVSILLLIAVISGGLAFTYVIVDDKPLMWRLAAGNIVGSAIFGLAAFVAACAFGFSVGVVVASLFVTMLPLVLLRRPRARATLIHDWAKAKGKLQGGNLKKFRGFAFYAFFFLLFWFFFDQAIYELKDGIYTGGSQNLGDLPFHLGAIFSFTDGNNFPPQNPSWAGAKFSYPFIADFLTACFMRLGADVKSAMFVQNVSWAFSLLVILESFAVKLTGSKLAGRIAPALLFLSGGLGFVWFAKDLWQSSQGLLNFLTHLPHDYTIGDQFRWGNSMVVLFITQRSLLLGLPLTVLVLGYLWRVFASQKADATGPTNFFTLSHFQFLPFVVGLVAGMLPLIHLHSLFVLFVVTGFLFIFQPGKWKTWVAFGVGVSVIAVPELAWSISGSATETTKFFDWHFGWDKRDANIFWFWFKNTGILIPVIIAAIFLLSRKDAKNTTIEGQEPKTTKLLLFYIPFAFLFVVSNTAKLAPWEWDNIKILIYWFVGSVPLIAWVIAWLWEQNRVSKIAAAGCVAVLTFAGSLDVWRTASGQIKSQVFDRDAIKIADQIKQKCEPHAIFLNAPTYNSAVVLSGRQSLMRYSGHLSSYGIDYGPREDDVKKIYSGGGVADILLRKYDIDYVLISPEERNSLQANDAFFAKFPLVAEAGQYRLYKVK